MYCVVLCQLHHCRCQQQTCCWSLPSIDSRFFGDWSQKDLIDNYNIAEALSGKGKHKWEVVEIDNDDGDLWFQLDMFSCIPIIYLFWPPTCGFYLSFWVMGSWYTMVWLTMGFLLTPWFWPLSTGITPVKGMGLQVGGMVYASQIHG